jgi:hypothetical protein
VGKKGFKGGCDDAGEKFVFALEMVIDQWTPFLIFWVLGSKYF